MSIGGETVYRGTATGCLAEWVVVSERVALPLGAGIPLEEAALLGCAALTGVGAALFAAGVTPGSSVLVIGAGGVGHSSCRELVSQGPRRSSRSTPYPLDANKRYGSARRTRSHPRKQKRLSRRSPPKEPISDSTPSGTHRRAPPRCGSPEAAGRPLSSACPLPGCGSTSTRRVRPA